MLLACARHRDKPPPDGWPYPRARVTKVFVFFFDVAPSGGCSAVVPRTHRLPAAAHSPVEVLAESFRSDGGDESEGALPLELMPNAVQFAVEAGTAVCFDNATWHTAMPHTGSDERRNVILAYSAWNQRSGLGAVAQRLEGLGKMEGERRRQLFGLGEGVVR